MSDPYNHDEWYEDDDDDDYDDDDVLGEFHFHTGVFCWNCGLEVDTDGLCPVCDYEPGFSTHSFDDVTPPSPTEEDDHDHE